MSSHILIVDDETNIRLMLRTALSSVGYVIEEAADGRAALAALEKRMPDVMILDLSLPLIDGLGVLKEIRGMRPGRKPRVIVLTAYGSISASVKAMRLGAMDFLEKPIVPDEIREAVEAVLNETEETSVEAGPDPLSGGYDAVLNRARRALRMAKYTDAESLIMKAADLAQRDAPYFNLLGALYETQREIRLAGKFYGKALDINPRYEPAIKNLRRLGEIKRTGRIAAAVVLGDEPDVYYARLPEHTGPVPYVRG